MLSCPSHSAITAMSTPDCSNAIAVPCRTTCGDTRFFFRVAQREDARSTAFRNNKWIANRVSGSPRMLGNAHAYGGAFMKAKRKANTPVVQRVLLQDHTK